MNRIYCSFLCTAFLLLNACDKSHTAKHSTQQPSWLKQCPDFSITGKATVVENAQCGQFELAENPENKNGDKIRVNVLRVPSINPVPQNDAVFIIAGGPGQSAVSIASMMAPLFNEIRKDRDLVFVDQRGTGQSNPLDCTLSDPLEKNLSQEQLEQLAAQEIDTCIKKYGTHLTYYATTFAVKDLDAVREQLGYSTINLWGASYGTRVALQYMREFPQHTRAVVIDGVAPTDIALPVYFAEDAWASLTSIAQQCVQQIHCTESYGDILSKAQSITQQLQKNPIAIDINHPRTQTKLHLTINAQEFLSLIRLALYDRDLSTLIPKIISDTAQSDYQLLGSLIFLAKSKTDLMGINQVMHYSVVCSEDFPLYKKLTSNTGTENIFSALNSVNNYSKICEHWPKANLPDDFWQYPTNNTPTLILSGAQDPATPPRWANLVKEHLTQSVSAVAPGGHHGISVLGCSSQLIALFIQRGTTQGLETKCIQNIQPSTIQLPAQIESSSASSKTISSIENSSAAIREEKSSGSHL